VIVQPEARDLNSNEADLHREQATHSRNDQLLKEQSGCDLSHTSSEDNQAQAGVGEPQERDQEEGAAPDWELLSNASADEK